MQAASLQTKPETWSRILNVTLQNIRSPTHAVTRHYVEPYIVHEDRHQVRD